MDTFHHHSQFSNLGSNRLLNFESVQPYSVHIPQRKFPLSDLGQNNASKRNSMSYRHTQSAQDINYTNFKSGSLYDKEALFKLKENLEKNREHIRDSGLLESLLTSINSRLINREQNLPTTDHIFRADEFDKNYNYYKSKLNPSCEFETPVKKVINKRLSSTPKAKRLNGESGLDVSLGFSDINPIENTPKKENKSLFQSNVVQTEETSEQIEDCNEEEDLSKHVTFKSTPDQLSSMADISELTECLITSFDWQNERDIKSTEDVQIDNYKSDVDYMNELKEQLRVERSANEEIKEKLELLQTCWVRRELQMAEEKNKLRNTQTDIDEMKAAVMEQLSDETIEEEEVSFSAAVRLLLRDLTVCRAEKREMGKVIQQQTEHIDHLNKCLLSLEHHQKVCDGVSKVTDEQVEDLQTRNEMLVHRVLDLEDSIKLLQDKFSFEEHYLPRLKIKSRSDSSSDEEDNFCNNDGNITVRKPPLK